MGIPFNIFMFYLDHGPKFFFASGPEIVRPGSAGRDRELMLRL